MTTDKTCDTCETECQKRCLYDLQEYCIGHDKSFWKQSTKMKAIKKCIYCDNYRHRSEHVANPYCIKARAVDHTNNSPNYAERCNVFVWDCKYNIPEVQCYKCHHFNCDTVRCNFDNKPKQSHKLRKCRYYFKHTAKIESCLTCEHYTGKSKPCYKGQIRSGTIHPERGKCMYHKHAERTCSTCSRSADNNNGNRAFCGIKICSSSDGNPRWRKYHPCSECKHKHAIWRMSGCKAATGCDNYDKWEQWTIPLRKTQVMCKNCINLNQHKWSFCDHYEYEIRKYVDHKCPNFVEKSEIRPCKSCKWEQTNSRHCAKQNTQYIRNDTVLGKCVLYVEKESPKHWTFDGKNKPLSWETYDDALDAMTHSLKGGREVMVKVNMKKTETKLEQYEREYKEEIERRKKLMSKIIPKCPEEANNEYFDNIKFRFDSYATDYYWGFTPEFVEYMNLGRSCVKFLKKLKIRRGTEYDGKRYIPFFEIKYKKEDIVNIDKDPWGVFEGILKTAIVKLDDFLEDNAKQKLCDLTNCFKRPKKNTCPACGTKNHKKAIFCCSCGKQIKSAPLRPRPPL